MLEIIDIKKDYEMKDETVNALKGVNICFRRSEFVSILGPSGCGKTTLLNIIGGLDRYTSGDLVIDGKSTKEFKDRDWDTYRNHSIGFVFQSYNLIPHQTALKNVELALSIGGISRKERRERALKALQEVGLGEQINKKPNQMSGGQCQRVAIARALVNDPEIILADEPTGALDSKTSVQVMDILKKISKNRLVIMVTHNPELAESYSTRIINMKDGEILSDSNPVSEKEREKLVKEYEKRVNALTEKEKKQKAKKSSMSLWSTFTLSGSNLLTKKKRTFITALACSIGIIGIAVILSVSTGMHAYVKQIEKDSMSVNYVAINAMSLNMDASITNNDRFTEYPTNQEIYAYESNIYKQNILDDKFIQYLETNINGTTEETSLVSGISYSRNISFLNNSTPLSLTGEIPNNADVLKDEYTAIATADGKAIPTEEDEICLIVDKYNRLTSLTLQQLGIDYVSGEPIDYNQIVGKELTLSLNASQYNVKIISILRQNKGKQTSWIQQSNTLMALTSTEIGYTKALADKVQQEFSDVVKVSGLNIYPKDFETKDKIVDILNNWNNKEIYKEYDSAEAKNHIIDYMDMSELLVGMLSDLIDITTYTLVAFSSVSLVVSSIMIAIITYASVIERTKEIGTIRSLGGRKKDVANMFRMEACTIGAVSATIALIMTLIINMIINIILGNLVGVTTIAKLSWSTALGMTALSILLNLIASLIPASFAAKQDPVKALRAE